MKQNEIQEEQTSTMKLILKNYGDYELHLGVTKTNTTIDSVEEAKELLSNLENVAEGLKEFIQDKRVEINEL